MLRAFRLNVVCLLTLLQLLAPLLHAHGGGNPAGDRLHLPGLEFLTVQDTESSAPARNQPAPGEFIVGVAQGCELQVDLGLSSTEAGLAPSDWRYAAAISPLTALEANAPPAATYPRPAYSQAIPRAPPQTPA
jgi:hypothetical protein